MSVRNEFSIEQAGTKWKVIGNFSQEDRKRLKIYFMEIGGHWSEIDKCFVFAEPISRENISSAIARANSQMDVSRVRVKRDELQAYFTPKKIAEYMQRISNISENDIVLEPSAGIGNLVDGLLIPKENIWLVEPCHDFCEVLRRKGYIHVIESTFESAVEKGMLPTNITRVLMNPPYVKQTDLIHLSLAYRLLSNGGILTTLVGRNSLTKRKDNQKSDALQEVSNILSKSNVLKVKTFPVGTFEETVCETCLLCFEKSRKKENKKTVDNKIVDERE